MQEVREHYYQDGNTVRKAQIQLSPARSLPNRKLREQERRIAAKRQQKAADQANAKELKTNRRLTGIMILGVVCIGILLVAYVSLQTGVSTKMNNIANLETELSDLKADNKAAESRIATSTNLTDIKNKAINELGMVYATSSQIVYYSVDSEDYMSQYYDIP